MRRKSHPNDLSSEQGHPPGDAQALLGRREDPYRPGRPARRDEHRRTLPPARRKRGRARSAFFAKTWQDALVGL